MLKQIRRFLLEENGQDALQMGMIVAAGAIIIVGINKIAGPKIKDYITNFANWISSTGGSGSGDTWNP